MFNQINDNIIKILGISALPQDQQKDAMDKMGAIVYQEVMLRVLEAMTDENKDEFEKLIETNPDPETMFKFLAEKVPSIETIATEEAERVREQNSGMLQ